MRIYIDQSGSMHGQDEILEAMLEEADKYPDAELYAFDSTVWPIASTNDLNRTGGGTTFPFEHAGNEEALILTDGEVPPLLVIPLNVKIIVFLSRRQVITAYRFSDARDMEIRVVDVPRKATR